jgi:hypothetical protein
MIRGRNSIAGLSDRARSIIRTTLKKACLQPGSARANESSITSQWPCRRSPTSGLRWHHPTARRDETYRQVESGALRQAPVRGEQSSASASWKSGANLAHFYRDCQKYVPIPERIFVASPYAAVCLSEHYDDKRHNLWFPGSGGSSAENRRLPPQAPGRWLDTRCDRPV